MKNNTKCFSAKNLLTYRADQDYWGKSLIKHKLIF